MQNHIKLQKIFFLILITHFTANAQQGTMITGGNLTSIGGSLSYSIGQTNYIYQTNIFGSISQGVQQPYEIFPVGILKDENFNAKVFPNPTSNVIELHLGNSTLENSFYLLYDSQGKIISTHSIKSPKTNISFDGSPIGCYFIEVVNNGISIEKFKIIKN